MVYWGPNGVWGGEVLSAWGCEGEEECGSVECGQVEHVS